MTQREVLDRAQWLYDTEAPEDDEAEEKPEPDYFDYDDDDDVPGYHIF